MREGVTDHSEKITCANARVLLHDTTVYQRYQLTWRGDLRGGLSHPRIHTNFPLCDQCLATLREGDYWVVEGPMVLQPFLTIEVSV